MAVEAPFDLEAVEITDELSLIVVWRRGTGFDGGEVRVADAVAVHLVEACSRTIDRIQNRDLRAYSPDMQLEDEECLVAADDALIADSQLAAVVLPTEPLPLLNSRTLPERLLYLYAVTVPSPDDTGGSVAFVRKTNPRTAAKRGSILALLGNTLSRVAQPAFQLEDYFDLVVSERGLFAMEQRLFELLFKETPALQERIPEWVDAIHSQIPLAGDGAERLATRCQSDGRLRRRVRSIAERGHLEAVTIDRIREHLADADLDEEDFLEGDELKIDEANPFQLIYMLNEDFFRGGLTDADFRSDRKSPR